MYQTDNAVETAPGLQLPHNSCGPVAAYIATRLLGHRRPTWESVCDAVSWSSEQTVSIQEVSRGLSKLGLPNSIITVRENELPAQEIPFIVLLSDQIPKYIDGDGVHPGHFLLASGEHDGKLVLVNPPNGAILLHRDSLNSQLERTIITFSTPYRLITSSLFDSLLIGSIVGTLAFAMAAGKLASANYRRPALLLRTHWLIAPTALIFIVFTVAWILARNTGIIPASSAVNTEHVSPSTDSPLETPLATVTQYSEGTTVNTDSTRETPQSLSLIHVEVDGLSAASPALAVAAIKEPADSFLLDLPHAINVGEHGTSLDATHAELRVGGNAAYCVVATVNDVFTYWRNVVPSAELKWIIQQKSLRQSQVLVVDEQRVPVPHAVVTWRDAVFDRIIQSRNAVTTDIDGVARIPPPQALGRRSVFARQGRLTGHETTDAPATDTVVVISDRMLTVRGRVLDRNAYAVPGAKVMLPNYEYVLSDGNGVYAIESDLVRLPTTLQVTCAGYCPRLVSTGVADSPASHGTNSISRDIILCEGATLEIRCRDELGSLLSDCIVVVDSEQIVDDQASRDSNHEVHNWDSRTLRTNEDGIVVTGIAPSCDYHFVISKPGYSVVAAPHVSVPSGDSYTLEIRLPTEHSLRIHVDPPLDPLLLDDVGVQVFTNIAQSEADSLVSSLGPAWAKQVTSNTITLRGLSAGKKRIRITGSEFKSIQLEADVVDRDQESFVTTERGQPLHGTVIDTTGNTVPGAVVTLFDDGANDTWHTVCDQDGRFSFHCVPTGTSSTRVIAKARMKSKSLSSGAVIVDAGRNNEVTIR